VVADFVADHPALNVSFQLEPRPFALGPSEFDVGICVGMPSEGRVVISRVFSYKSSFVATPAFLERYGLPKNPQDIARLPVVTVFHETEMSQRSVFQTNAGLQIRYTSKLAVNDTSLALKAVLSGRYIGKLMHWYMEAELLSGQVVKVLPECTEEKTLYTIVQARKGSPRKVQLFVDYMKSRVQNQLVDAERRTESLAYWDQVKLDANA
jgi:DNA-binding transcriptional LysR family regulator